MRNIVFGSLLIFCAMISCTRDDESLQKIDQIMTFYIKTSSGQDLLNPTKVGSYSQVRMNDVFGEKDNSPVTFSGPTMQPDSTYTIEYTASATRNLLSSGADDNRIYQSKIAFELQQKVNDTLFQTVSDTMEIQYRWTPTVFEVSKVFYNKKEVFSKTATSGNTFTITK